MLSIYVQSGSNVSHIFLQSSRRPPERFPQGSPVQQCRERANGMGIKHGHKVQFVCNGITLFTKQILYA